MILKIKYKNTWYMYDHIFKVRFGRCDGTISINTDNKVMWSEMPPEGSTMPRSSVEVQPFAMLSGTLDSHLETAHKEGAEPTKLNWAIGRNTKGEELLFVFDEGYLLNDDGKTIETIRY